MSKKNRAKVIFLILIVIIVGLFWYFNIGHYLTLENLKKHSSDLRDLVAAHSTIAALLFTALYSVIITFSLPGAAILSLAGGFLFGMTFGTFLNMVGATVGAVASFLMTRFLIGAALQKKFSQQLTNFNQELDHYGIYYLFAVRLIPLFPFFLVNILCGLTKISLSTFFITTVLGIIPGSLIYTYAGTQLSSITSIRDIFSTKLLVAFLLLACFIMLSLVIKRLWQKK